MFKINSTWLLLLAALNTTAVMADPSSYTHSSGAKVVDINTPNASGLSHNIYKDFSVSEKGLVLNNSGMDITSSVGRLTKNDNLANGSATVILNEVISNSHSSLKGFIEVAGQKADVIVANPNGITCSGCSFINAGNTTLTTGTPLISEDGRLSGYKVRGGVLTIEGKGLQQSDYATLLAKSIRINGQIQADGVQARAGDFDINNETGEVTTYQSGLNIWNLISPQYSIDVSSLGGISANSIELVGNAVGVGVRNAGTLAADNISIISNGTLLNSGKIDAQQQMYLQGQQRIENSGTVASAGTLSAISAQKIENSGDITAQNAATMLVLKGDTINKGNISAPKLIMATVDENLDTTIAAGTLTNSGKIKAVNGQFFSKNFEQNGDLQASGIAMVTADNVNNSGTFEGQKIAINTVNLTNANKATIAASEALQITTSGNLLNVGTLKSDEQMALNIGNKLENTGDCFWAWCTSGTIEAKSMQITAPNISRAQNIGGNVIFSEMSFNKE